MSCFVKVKKENNREIFLNVDNIISVSPYQDNLELTEIYMTDGGYYKVEGKVIDVIADIKKAMVNMASMTTFK